LLEALGTGVLLGEVETVLAQVGAPASLPAEGTFRPAPDHYPYGMPIAELDDAEELAAVERWIDDNRAALDGVVAASRRPRLWVPVVRDADGAIAHALRVHRLGDLADPLATRSDLRHRRGDAAGAWSDAQALLRLQVLVDQLSGSMARAVASGIRGRALECLKRTFESSPPDEATCKDVLRTLTNLPARRTAERDVDVFDRYFVLDAYIHGVDREIREASGDPAFHPANAQVNLVLREINRALDETLPALRRIDREHVERLDRLVEERRARAKELAEELGQPVGQLRHLLSTLTSGGDHVGQVVGEVLAVMVVTVTPVIVERIHVGETRRRVATLAAALHLHACRAGAFPGTLDDLLPGTFTALPTHPLDGGAIPYERTEDGCRVGDEDWSIELTLP
jgi:hypothetical protein